MRSEARSPADPASRAVNVTPTTSQCQSNALAAIQASSAPVPDATNRVLRARSSRDEQEEECGDKERESDQPELRERLHVEGVPVAHDEQVRAPLVPQVLERASSVAGERPVAACIPGDAKLLAPAVSGDAEEALVQVDVADAGSDVNRSSSFVTAALGPPTDSTTATTPSNGDGDERHVEDAARPP